jgi:ribosomal protein S27E
MKNSGHLQGVTCVECGQMQLLPDGPQTLKCDLCGNRQHDRRGTPQTHPELVPADRIGR